MFGLIQRCKEQQAQQAAAFWSVRFRDMLMVAPDPPMHLLLPMCLWAALVQQSMACTRVWSRSGVLYNIVTAVITANTATTKYLVAHFRGTLLLAPAAAAAAVGCLGPASNVLYSSSESVALSLCTAVITENTTSKTMF